MSAENTYKHYKGNMYRVVGIAHHSETLEELVVYRALYDHPTYGTDALWIRPKTMFFENVTLPSGEVVPRFKKCDEDYK
jgi:hypothetical protein